MEFTGDTFRVWRDETTNTLYFQGRLRLNGREAYQPLIDLIDDSIRANPGAMSWDLRSLEFINGSGLNVIYRAVLQIQSSSQKMALLVKGTDAIAWQQTALPNIKKLMPGVRLAFDNGSPGLT